MVKDTERLHLVDGIKTKKQNYISIEQSKWSEEDESMLNNVIDALVPLSQTTHSCYAIGSMINWLKSLHPQKHWKPSEEQLKTLDKWLEDNRYNGNVRYAYPIFAELLRQLKAL